MIRETLSRVLFCMLFICVSTQIYSHPSSNTSIKHVFGINPSSTKPLFEIPDKGVFGSIKCANTKESQEPIFFEEKEDEDDKRSTKYKQLFVELPPLDSQFTGYKEKNRFYRYSSYRSFCLYLSFQILII